MSLTVKRSARFSFAVELQIKVDGDPVTDLTGWQALCSIYREDGTKLTDATTTLTPGWLHIDGGSCAAWPVGNAMFDVLLIGKDGSTSVFATVEPDRG